MACTVVFSGPPLLSSLWFPPQQRVTATAIAAMAYYVGIATAFVLGKLHARLSYFGLSLIVNCMVISF